jgi:succinyl-CoA synthetase beta subunit
MELLARYGVPFPPARLATSAAEAADIAADMGYPVALKIESAQISHKTEVGGVALQLQQPEALAAAWAAIASSVQKKAPQATIDGMLVQKMSAGDVEFVIGLQHDPSFGPVIMAGLGGIFIEVLKDVVFRQCPISPAQAEQMLDDLRAKAILDGARGKMPVDRQALAELISRVSQFASDAGPRLSELDLNPILIRGNQMVAVDALLTLNVQ